MLKSISKTCLRIFLLAGIAVSVRAQAPPFACSVQAGVSPTVRVEGFAELLSDIVISCTGGTPTPAGQAFPQFNFTVTLNTNVTSAPTASGQFDEALMFIDEPISPGPNANRPLLNCGNSGAPDNGNPGAGVCSILSRGNPALSYDGTPNGFGAAACDGASGRPAANTYGCGRPNAFQGVLGTPQNPGALNAVTFYNVPLDPPGPSTTRTLRFTNLRANAATLGLNLSSFPSEVQATVTSNGSVPVLASATPVGIIVHGLINGTVFGAPACQSPCVQVSEGFANAWKPKNISLYLSNGVPRGPGEGSVFNGTANYPVDAAQNEVGAIYNSESGYEWQNNGINGPPSPNPPVSVGTTLIQAGESPLTSLGFGGLNTGISSDGIAAAGTRIALTFSGIPQGASVQVPQVVFLSYIGGASPQFGRTDLSGVMVLTNTDSAGAGPFSQASTGVLPGNLAVYEVLFADASGSEFANIPYTLLNAPPGATVQVTTSLAPLYSDTAAQQANASFPVPRFGVPPSEAFCPAGVNGPGANYNPQIAFCDSGVVVPNGDSFCLAGVNGQGGIYDPGLSSCLSGAIVPFGDSFCPAGANGPGAAYNPSFQSCASGVVVPSGDLYCPAGANGQGGIYDPTVSSCNLGLVVPNNALPPAVPSSQISVTTSGFTYSRVSQTYNGTVTMQNISGGIVNGPLELFFNGLPSGVTLVGASGSLSGNPYVLVCCGGFPAGVTASLNVQFKNPSNAIIKFTPVLRSGSLN